MRILHCIDSAGIYGAEVMLLNLMEEQKSLGLYPILLNIEQEGYNEISDIYKVAVNKGLNVVTIISKKGFDIGCAHKILAIAKEHNVSIIHSHSYKSNIILGFLSNKKRKIPVISTAHGWTSVSIFSRIWIYNIVDKMSIKKLDAVVYVNPVLGNIIRHKRPYFICNGLPDIEFSNFACDKIQNKSDKYIIIGAISRLSEEKGIIYLLQAIKSLIQDGHKVYLYLIGDGPLRSYFGDYILKNNLSEYVKMIGYVSNAFKYLIKFDLFVLPSLTEGLPITLLESMQSGTPIIATDVGSISYVLKNGQYGSVIKPKNAESIIIAIKEYISNKDIFVNRAALAKDYVKSNFSSRVMATNYLNVYKEVVTNYG